MHRGKEATRGCLRGPSALHQPRRRIRRRRVVHEERRRTAAGCATAVATDAASPGMLAMSARARHAVPIELRGPAIRQLRGGCPARPSRGCAATAAADRRPEPRPSFVSSSRKRGGEEVTVGVAKSHGGIRVVSAGLRQSVSPTLSCGPVRRSVPVAEVGQTGQPRAAALRNRLTFSANPVSSVENPTSS